jgi:PAS domain S-box-containing protein
VSADRPTAPLALGPDERDVVLEAAFAGAQCAIAISDVIDGGRQFRIVAVNRTAAEWSGIAEEQWPGRSPQQILGETEGAAVTAHYQRALKAGVPIEYEERLQLPAGEVWALTTVSPVRDSSGSVTRIVATSTNITALKRAEAALAEQKRLYQTVTDNASTALFIMDEHQQCVFMNPAAEQLTGYTLAETRGRPLHEVVHHTRPDGSPYPLDECPIDQAFPKNDRMPGEEVFVHKDGHFYEVAFMASPVRDAGGRPVGTVIEVREIGARKRLERELAQSEALFRAFMDNSPAHAWLKDTAGRYCFVSRSVREVFPMELVGRTDDELFDAARAAEYVETDRAVLAADAPLRISDTWHPGGDARTMLAIKFPVRGADGGRYVGGFAVDVTEQRRAEEALRESEVRFRAMADSSPVMIWSADPHGGIEFVNRAYCDFFGVSEEAVRGPGRWVPLLHPEDVEGYLGAFKRALAERAPFRGEVRVRRGDGAWRWLASYAAPRFAPSGEFLGLVGSSPDITDLKDAEAALREADRRKDEFLATLAHELRNPLAPLRSGLGVLQRAGDNAAARAQVVAAMDRQVTHMVRLVDDLLEVSRITRGVIQLREESVDLVAVVAGAIESAMPSLQAAHQHLRVKLPAEPLWLRADPVRIAQVVGNLLNNATKYSDAGGHIEVSLQRESDEAVLVIRDDGVGIPPEVMPRMFELFAQVDRHLGRAQGGLGIGLALVKRLVAMHGGTVGCASEGVDRGASFTVRLPLTHGREGTAGIPRTAERDRDPPLHILVVDDNTDAADSLGLALRLLGHQVHTEYGGEEARQYALRFRPQVVLLDLGMPKCDGLEVARAIRAEAWGRSALIVAVTGWGQEQDRQRTHEAGFDAHLVKPIDHEALRRLLTSFAEHAGTR